MVANRLFIRFSNLISIHFQSVQQQQQQQQPAANATETESEIAGQELLSYDELCNDTVGGVPNESAESALPLPPIDILQPLTIGLEQPSAESFLTPTTSSSASVAGGVAATTEPTTTPSESSSYDEVEQILKAIKGEFKEQDIIVIDGDNTDNDVINVYSSNEECEQDGT